MILQHKKSGKRVSITRAEYDTLRKVGFAGGWTIISNIDETEPTPKKIIPKDIIDFSTIKQTKPKKKKHE